MKSSLILWSVVLVILGAMLACSPKATPVQQPTVSAIAPISPVKSPEETEWAKVVEAAKKEGKVVAFTWGLTGTPGDKIVKFFKDKYGIEIERVTGLTATLIERIKSDQAAGRYVADFFDASVSSNYALKAAGATEPIAGLLPVLREQGAFYRSPQTDVEGHLINTSISIYSFSVNTKLVSPAQEPKSWREVIEPRWAGKIVTSSPVTSPDIITIYVQRSKLGLDDEYFRQLGKLARMTPAGRDAGGMLSRGEAHLWLPHTATHAGDMVVAGAPIKMIQPKEGTVASIGNTMVRIRNGPNPNATRFFINWLLTAEGQKITAEARSWAPLRKDVPDYTPQVLSLPLEKAVPQQIDDVLKVAEIQRDKSLAKMMGVE